MNQNYLKAILGPGGPLDAALADGEGVMLRVVGHCMAPNLGNQASVRLERPKFFIPGDIVAFYCPCQRRLIAHRFLGYVRSRGAWRLMTMADRGTRPDPFVNSSCILGRVTVQFGGVYRIRLSARLEALRRYLIWCVIGLVRRLIA